MIRLPLPRTRGTIVAAIAAMQSINVAVLCPPFLSVFVGTAAIGVAGGIVACLRWEKPGSAYLLAGGALFVIGTFLVTIALSVPLNDSLAKVTPTDPQVAGHWKHYATAWTRWNHVRTGAALAAMVIFVAALGGIRG